MLATKVGRVAQIVPRAARALESRGTSITQKFRPPPSGIGKATRKISTDGAINLARARMARVSGFVKSNPLTQATRSFLRVTGRQGKLTQEEASMRENLKTKKVYDVVKTALDNKIIEYEVKEIGKDFVHMIGKNGYGTYIGEVCEELDKKYWITNKPEKIQEDTEKEHNTGRIIFARVYTGAFQIKEATSEQSKKLFKLLADICNNGEVNITYESKEDNSVLSNIDRIVNKERISFTEAANKYSMNKKNIPKVKTFMERIGYFEKRNNDSLEKIKKLIEESRSNPDLNQRQLDYISWYFNQYQKTVYPVKTGGGYLDISNYPDIESIITEGSFDELVYSTELPKKSNLLNENIKTEEDVNIIIDKMNNNIDKIWNIFNNQFINSIPEEKIPNLINYVKQEEERVEELSPLPANNNNNNNNNNGNNNNNSVEQPWNNNYIPGQNMPPVIPKPNQASSFFGINLNQSLKAPSRSFSFLNKLVPPPPQKTPTYLPYYGSITHNILSEDYYQKRNEDEKTRLEKLQPLRGGTRRRRRHSKKYRTRKH